MRKNNIAQLDKLVSEYNTDMVEFNIGTTGDFNSVGNTFRVGLDNHSIVSIKQKPFGKRDYTVSDKLENVAISHRIRFIGFC